MKNIVLFLCVFLSACSWLEPEWDPTEETFYLHYYKQECDSGLCYRYREDEADSYESLTETIEGFSGFEWGTNYTLLVEEQKKGSGRERDLSLIRVISDEPVGTGSSSTFALTLSTSKGAITDGNGTEVFKLYDEKSFICEGEDCTEIGSAKESKSKVSVEFQLSDDMNGDLLLKEVKCKSSDNDFASECEGENEDTYYIAPFKTECMAPIAGLCHLFRKYKTGVWQILDVDITGNFEYEWGKLTQINVTETIDDTKIRTSFKWDSTEEPEIATEVDTYELLVKSTGLGELNSENIFTVYAGESAFSLKCQAEVDCTALSTFSSSNDKELVALLKVKVSADDPSSLLELQSGGVLCQDPKNSFVGKCLEDPDHEYLRY